MWINEDYVKNLPWRSCSKNPGIYWIFIDEYPELTERIRIAGGSFSSSGFVYEIRKDRKRVERFIVRFPAKQKKLTEKAAV